MVKVLTFHAWDPLWAPVLIPVASLPIQLPACGLGSSRGQPKTFRPCTRMEDPEEIPGSWLRIGIASAVALTCGVNHRTQDLPLCLSSLYISLSNKKQYSVILKRDKCWDVRVERSFKIHTAIV